MSDASFIPQANLHAAYLAQQAEIDAAVARVMESGTYILGDECAALESEFADAVGAPFGVAVGSGTDAIELALRACGIGPGDAVLTVSHTAVATVAAIERAGALPVFVDIDPKTYTMSPASLQAALAERSLLQGHVAKGVLPVHLYGHPAGMPALCEIAAEHGLRIIEDCAQAAGAELGGQRAGTFGDVAAFSFYPTKNLGAFGDAGMVVTAEKELADRVRRLRQYGWDSKRECVVPGLNSRTDELQAAILRVRLRRLEEDNDSRRRIASEYAARLAAVPFGLPESAESARHVFHQYVIRTTQRASLCEHLARRDVGSGIHYPLPAHLQAAYAGRVPRVDDLSHTEQAARQVLSLPMYPQLSAADVERVAAACVEWAASHKPD